MTEVARIVEAIKASNVTRVAFVDDAFDPPEIPETDWGELLQYLTEPNAEQTRTNAGIDAEIWWAAVEGINTGLRDAVDELIRHLYSAYLRTFEATFDPMGAFARLKGSNLGYVRPLLSLVQQASPEVETFIYGSQMDAVDVQDGPHVVFVDLFLDPDVSPVERPKAEQGEDAVRKSLDRIKPLLRLSPSVILMSSHPDAPQVRNYRQSMEEKSRVYASRFGFVDKKHIARDAANTVTVDPKSSDVLLDVFQTYKFGRSLHEILAAWLKAAHEAVNSLKGEIDDLELADLAYLVRFRLSEEGQGLTDYLEWLLGECLTDQVGRNLDAGLPKSQIDKEAREIDGAFEGPTRKVADLYHRVRIENKRNRPREHFRLGDLYLRKPQEGADDLLAVMNPDCDLVRRPKTGKPGANAVLTLRGRLESYKTPSTSVGDFIVIDNVPKNIKWDYRHVETLPFDGVMSGPGQSDASFTYLGAMRPIYAQEIQTKLLNQLGRVGVPVPPALAFETSVILLYAAKGGKLTTIEFSDEASPCYFVPARQSDQKGILVFRRQFVRRLVETLSQIDSTTLSAGAAGQLKSLLSESGLTKLRKLTYEGGHLESDIGNGLLLSKDKPRLGDQSTHWACLLVAMRE